MNEAFVSVTMPKAMGHLRITEFASQQAVPRRYLDSHGDWIEHKRPELAPGKAVRQKCVLRPTRLAQN